MTRLIDYFTDWQGNGIFQNLGAWTPWHNNTAISKAALDWEYFGNRSGYKAPSPYLIKTLPPYRVLDAAQIAKIDKLLQALFADKWNRLYNAFHLEYEIGANVDLTETVETEGARDSNGSETGSANSNIHSTGDNTNSVVPFGTASGTYVEINKQAADATTSGSDEQNTTARETENAEDYSETRTHHTTGKNGGIEYSESVKNEINLRQTSFFGIIFRDVDDVLTIPYWGE